MRAPALGIDRAVASVGGQVELAAALGVTQQAVSSWCRCGYAPKGRRAQIEALTGIPQADLSPPTPRRGRPAGRSHDGAPRVVYVTSFDPLPPWLPVPVAAATLGVTVHYIEQKIASGVWREGEQWARDASGETHVVIKGVMCWIEGKGAKR
jgi:DNA-binding transcriptional regulator YdaS (Cro superfamily)